MVTDQEIINTIAETDANFLRPTEIIMTVTEDDEEITLDQVLKARQALKDEEASYKAYIQVVKREHKAVKHYDAVVLQQRQNLEALANLANLTPSVRAQVLELATANLAELAEKENQAMEMLRDATDNSRRAWKAYEDHRNWNQNSH
jgi:hypothetical protein